jgi:hypothetical protein
MIARPGFGYAWLAFVAAAVAVPVACFVVSSPPDREWPLPEAVARLEKAGFRCHVIERDHLGDDGLWHFAGLYVCRGDAWPDWDAAAAAVRCKLAGPVVALNVIRTSDGPVLRLDGHGRLEVWGEERRATAVRKALQ